MTTETQALAVREYTDNQLKQRIKLNQQAGYGLERANPAQLNVIFLLCQRYDLDPVEDLTLYEGRPWITVTGRLRLLRRHPDYRGFDCRPLSKSEKEAWGYEPDDIVVEATIRTANWGEIKARGKVSASEVQQARERARDSGKRSAPIGVHPVEIAEKRAVGRAERAAFGQDAVLDDEQVEQSVQTVIEERANPERVARESATYDRIVGDFYPDEREHSSAASSPAPRSDEASEDDPPASSDALVKRKDHPLWVRWLEMERAARAHNVDQDTSTVRLGHITEAQLAASITTLQDVIDSLGAAAGPEQAEF